MEITFANDFDSPSIRHIWKECFCDPETYMDAFFTSVFNVKNTIVAKDNEKCVGALQLFSHEVVSFGKSYKAMYIGGVSVLPAYRNRKIATCLMGFAEEYMKSQGFELSFLVPFNFGFYEKLGYKCFSYLSKFSGSITSLSSFVLPYKEKAKNDCAKAYCAFTDQFNVYLKRDNNRYENEILPLCNDFSLYSLEENRGYIIYKIENKALFVSEICYLDETSLKRLLGFIYSFKDSVKNFNIIAPADGKIRGYLCETTIYEERFPHAMYKALGKVTIDSSMENYINMLGWF